jgi:hypothetical protein
MCILIQKIVEYSFLEKVADIVVSIEENRLYYYCACLIYVNTVIYLATNTWIITLSNVILKQ